MSRRESRASLNARQNDALFEFENFKKKFLLANKHITKLNSTLSVRIEELNAQITTLYTENLRLRASEIALAAQLKREREKSRKVMADAEAATLNLTKHLSYLRQSLNIQESPHIPPSPPSPQARRPPPPNPNFSPSTPQGNRISRPPNVPGIYEDDEAFPSSSEQDPGKPPSPARRKTSKAKPRLSASKLPLPSRVASPPPIPTPSHPLHVDLTSIATAAKRKAARRQSGLLTVNTDTLPVPRPASPAFGSPIRLEAGRAEEAEETAAVNGDVEIEVLEVEVAEGIMKKEKRKSKPKDRESEGEKDGVAVESMRSREKKRQRDEDDGMSAASKFKLKDVTNSRTALQPIDNTVRDQVEAEAPSAARAFLANLPESTSRPNSQGSSSPAPPGASETDGAAQGGRERRARKSVNYTEPKLNTKMRKPDPPPGSESARPAAPKKRSSAAAVMPSTSYKPSDDNGNDADNDTEARSSLELPLRGSNGNYINPELFPLPPSRPGSALTAGLFSPGPSRTSGSSSTSTSSSGSGDVATAVKRKKSRPQMMPDEEESDDGADADEEYIPPGRKGAGSWVNIEGRRKTGGVSSGTTTKRSSGIVDDEGRRLQEVDSRRHSMAV